MTQEVTQEVRQEVTQEVSQEVSQEVTQEVRENATTVRAKVTTQQASEPVVYAFKKARGVQARSAGAHSEPLLARRACSTCFVRTRVLTSF